MLYLAYDGTTHGDWVARYAIRIAASSSDRRLNVVCLTTAGGDAERTRGEPWRNLERECSQQHVTLAPWHDVIPANDRSDIADRLNQRVPQGRDSFLVCGTRVRSRGRGFLPGSVAQSLLARANRNVLALHVVQPGLLGHPGDVLIPVSGHPRGIQLALPWLRRLGPDLRRIHVLLVAQPPRDWWRSATTDDLEASLAPWREYVGRIERDLASLAGLRESLADVTVIAARDAVAEIINHANRTRSRLIFLGASERTVGQRLWAGDPVERILAGAPCDVAIYRGVS